MPVRHNYPPELVNAVFPEEWLAFDPKAPPSPFGQLKRGVPAPEYGLGWLIELPGIGELSDSFMDVKWDFAFPNWRAKQCKPESSKMFGTGFMIPDVQTVGLNQIFIRIAKNMPMPLQCLKNKRTRRQMIDYALLSLEIPKGSFDHDGKLIWLRWATGTLWDDSKDRPYTTIGKFYPGRPPQDGPPREGELPHGIRRIISGSWKRDRPQFGTLPPRSERDAATDVCSASADSQISREETNATTVRLIDSQ